jgi:MFS family permease
MPYFGAIVGPMMTGTLGDNLGRKSTLLVCLVVSIVGYMVTLLADSLAVAAVGLFLVGLGVESCLNLVMVFAC